MPENKDNEIKRGLHALIEGIKKEDAARDIDAKGRLVERGVPTGDPVVDMFFNDPISEEAYQVLRIRYTESKRMYIEAALLATDDNEKIADLFEVDLAVIDIYQYIYYNVKDMDEISKIKLVEQIKDSREQQLKLWAISQGIDFISWRIGKAPKISPVEGLTSLYADCFYKAKEAFFNSNTSDPSKEGLRWAKQATDIARLLKAWVSDSDEAMQDIKIALKEITGDNTAFSTLEDLVDGEDAESVRFLDDEEEDKEESPKEEEQMDFFSTQDLKDENT